MSDIQSPDDAFRSNGATAERDESGRFLAGNKSSPGRKGGTRVKLSQKFFEALSADFEEHGVAAIARVRFLRPDVYFSVVAKLMPQKIEVSTPTDGMTDEQLHEMMEVAQRMIALKSGQVIEGGMRNVTPVLPPALADAPPTEAAQRAEAHRRDLHDQHDALRAVEPAIPAAASSVPHPVGRTVPISAREVERRNIAKLTDDSDLDPASLF